MKQMNQCLEKRWVVVGVPSKRIKEVVDGIVTSCGKTVHRSITNRAYTVVEFTDGTTLRSVPMSESARGMKFGKMWCNNNIDRDILEDIIMPGYYGDEDDIIWL